MYKTIKREGKVWLVVLAILGGYVLGSLDTKDVASCWVWVRTWWVTVPTDLEE